MLVYASNRCENQYYHCTLLKLPRVTTFPSLPLPHFCIQNQIIFFIIVKPILSVSDDQRVIKGSNVTFSCNITAANPSTTSVTWKNQTNKLIQHSNGVVVINSVSVEQGGRYTCHANNSAGESQKLFTLTVGEYFTNSKNVREFRDSCRVAYQIRH